MDDCLLSDISSRGAFYTWSNGRFGASRVESCLDRALGNLAFFQQWPEISCSVLPRHQSDHSPILLNCNFSEGVIPRFQFFSMWIMHPGLQDLIATSWRSSSTSLRPMQLLGFKLKSLRGDLRV